MKMDKRMQDRILDRLAALAGSDDGERLADYLDAAERRRELAAKRQRRAVARKLESGHKRVTTYLHEDVHRKLVAAYPTPAGAVDWQAVAQAALSVAPKMTVIFPKQKTTQA